MYLLWISFPGIDNVATNLYDIITTGVWFHGLTESKHSLFIDRYAARTPLPVRFKASLKPHLEAIFIRFECQMCVSSQVHLSSLLLYSSARSRGRRRALRDGSFFLLDPSTPAVCLAIYREQRKKPFTILEHHMALLVDLSTATHCGISRERWQHNTMRSKLLVNPYFYR